MSEPSGQAQTVPQPRPYERHADLVKVIEAIRYGISAETRAALLNEIDRALNITGNDSYTRGMIDQADDPIPAETIARLKADRFPAQA